jgi:ABC-type multidrug transport system ATPase subunit/peptidoglycan/LPS O-acetylase OafA/YrhL
VTSQVSVVSNQRIHSLDAVRGFALLLGLVVHTSLAFVPGMSAAAWPVLDHSRSTTMAVTFFAAHLFRMVLFFMIAGFFAHLLMERRGMKGFWANRGKRIGVPLVAGWVVLAPLTLWAAAWGTQRALGEAAPAPVTSMPALPPGFFLFLHLWFLYYLLLFYAAASLIRGVTGFVDRAGRLTWLADRLVAGIVKSGWLVVLLGLPAAWVLYRQADWSVWVGIPTPEYSVIPQLPAVAAYGMAFAVGWVLHRHGGLLASIQKRGVGYLLGAIVLTAACLLWKGNVPAALAGKLPELPKLGFALLYTGAAWLWSFGIMGLALRHLDHESHVRRYLADASYWIYLAHLPLVLALQGLLAPLSWPWFAKFPLIVGATLAVLLVSYHYLVRPTFLGELLNGRKYPRRAAPAGHPAAAAPAEAGPDQVAADGPDRGVLVELQGASKRYGKLTALHGLDLTVRSGELLAVLGPNGAGKSTAISICLGLTQPDGGEARLLGRSPLDIEARRNVGVMMQEALLAPELRVRELIELSTKYYPEPMSTAQVLELTGTRPIAARPYGKLSSGQKRQAQFALAVCGRPRLLFLDEPTVGLDLQAREAMWRTLRVLIERGCSIVLTTHYLEEAEALADRVVVLAGGRSIAEGTVDEIRSVVSRRKIRCVTTVSEETARQWPEVIEAHRDARHLHLTAADAEAVVQRLFASDPTLRGLEVNQAGLAEAFAELTKEAA